MIPKRPAKKRKPAVKKPAEPLLVHSAMELLIRQGRAHEVADTIMGANGAATALTRLFTEKMMEWLVHRDMKAMGLGEAQIVHEMNVSLLEALAKVHAAAGDVLALGAGAFPVNGDSDGRAITGEILPAPKRNAVELFRAERGQ